MINSNNKEESKVVATNLSSEIKNINVDRTIDLKDTGATCTIDSAKVNGDILSLYVNYSGGCKTHSFELNSNGTYAKSLPPQTYAEVKHISNGDACRQLISQELKFNISKLKYEGQKTVIVNLKNGKRVYYSAE